jgi:hypothetical protein
VYFSIYNLVKPSLFKEILAMVVQNLNGMSLCFLHAVLMVVTNYHLLLPTKYKAHTNSWMTTKVCEDYLKQMDRKLGVRNCKILLYIDQCAVHPKNITFSGT